jgi:hypothetical protein
MNANGIILGPSDFIEEDGLVEKPAPANGGTTHPSPPAKREGPISLSAALDGKCNRIFQFHAQGCKCSDTCLL